MKKRILILGPISDFGGREMMTNLLAHALKDNFQVKILSTIAMTKASAALINIDKNSWDTINYYLYRNNFILKLTALLTKTIFKREEPAYFFIKNKLVDKYFNFSALYYNTIHGHIKAADVIICSNEITGKWLEETLVISGKEDKPILIRITGKIKSIPDFILTLSKKNVQVLVHSKQNVDKLEPCLGLQVCHIDQTTPLETSLINLSIDENDVLTYGFLGRFSEEKGIKELLQAFAKNNKKLLLAGNGPLKKEVVEVSTKSKNIDYIGELVHSELYKLFNKIDVFIIPSFEEGGPLVGLEAMAAGKLIISTKVGAMPERLQQTGNDYWFSHDVPNSLQQAIEAVEELSSAQRLKIRDQVRKKYIEHNSFKSIQKKYLELVGELIKLE